MMLQRVVRAVTNKQTEVFQLARALVSNSFADWTPEYLTLLIGADTVPKTYIDTATKYVYDHPCLANLQKEQFLAAVYDARPELYPYLTTRQGDAWLEHAMKDLGGAIAMRPINWLFGRE